jgi:hypothetical protein
MIRFVSAADLKGWHQVARPPLHTAHCLPHICLTCLWCVALTLCCFPRAAGGNWVEEGGTRFYSNPAQKPASEECTDVAPDDRFTCEQQVSCSEFGLWYFVQSVYYRKGNGTCLVAGAQVFGGRRLPIGLSLCCCQPPLRRLPLGLMRIVKTGKL